MIDLKKRIQIIAEKKIYELYTYGFVKPGNNGPYICNDTPVRNTAHWCIILSYLFNENRNETYENALKIAVNYLATEQKKTKNGTICCMTDNKFDKINGLIGQAWCIEGLVSAYETLHDEKLIQIAKEIFNAQRFDEKIGYWERIDVDGNNLSYDEVFNHQLWFTASGALIYSVTNDENIYKLVESFLNHCNEHFIVRNSGRISHYGDRCNSVNGSKFKNLVKKCLPSFVWRLCPDKLHPSSYEDAYHLFNLYGFALIYNNGFKSHEIFKQSKFNSALKYGKNIKYINKSLNVSKYEKTECDKDIKNKICMYGYGYNSPAFEYGYVMKTFFPNEDVSATISKLLDIQDNIFFSTKTKMYDRNTFDSETLTARLYEVIRYMQIVDN